MTNDREKQIYIKKTIRNTNVPYLPIGYEWFFFLCRGTAITKEVYNKMSVLHPTDTETVCACIIANLFFETKCNMQFISRKCIVFSMRRTNFQIEFVQMHRSNERSNEKKNEPKHSHYLYKCEWTAFSLYPNRCMCVYVFCMRIQMCSLLSETNF